MAQAILGFGILILDHISLVVSVVRSLQPSLFLGRLELQP